MSKYFYIWLSNTIQRNFLQLGIMVWYCNPMTHKKRSQKNWHRSFKRIHSILGFLGPPAPKSQHRDFISYEGSALTYASPPSSYNNVAYFSWAMFCFKGRGVTCHSVCPIFLVPPCLFVGHLPGMLALDIFLFLRYSLPSSLDSSLYLSHCSPVLPIPLLPSYWLFSILLGQSSPFNKVKQMQHIFM